MAKEHIGIMGGSFDPIHLGHIRMAQCALSQARLDRVLMLPTGNPPHKQGITPAEDRFRMVAAACAGLEGLEPCREEIDRAGVIYTVDTLSILREKYPRSELFYIIGADTLMELKNWRRYTDILGLCTFLVCPRSWHYTEDELSAEQKRLESLGGRFQQLDMEVIDISSTQVREAIREGVHLPNVPVQVMQYAASAGLYGAALRIPSSTEWLDKLWQTLTHKRFSHTLAVADTARQLALLHGLDADKAEAAGLLHDCAKCLPLKEMQRIAKDAGLTQDKAVLHSGALLHSAVGAYVAQTAYGVTDEAVLSAIRSHTTGRPGMSQLDMAVWLADTIEPTRSPFPTLEKVRTLASLSLERAILTSLEGTLAHVRKKGEAVHPLTQATIDWLRNAQKTP